MSRSQRTIVLAVSGVLVVALVTSLLLVFSGAANGGERGASGSSTSSVATTTTSSAPARPKVHHAPRFSDGSLGNQATREACTLLSRTEIHAAVGGPVGAATPTYPYCQWLLADGSFLALAVEPHTSFNEATQYVDTLQSVSGLGQEAIIANNRYLYFTADSTSYWLLWQQAANFSELDESQLVALGHDVLAHALPVSRLGPEPAGPPGPPIYFAGDSTAAGPEWAWWAFHANNTTLRTLTEYQVGTGFVRPDFFNWQAHLLAVAAARRPRLVIWMGSANDDQDLFVHGAYQAPGSALWDAAYARIVGATMRSLVAEGCKVLWIGEPAMESPSLSAAMQVIDRIYAKEAALHPGVTFYNPGVVLNTPSGGYAGSLVIHGVLTPVRLDGIHLNVAGSEVLADAIAPYVLRLLGLRSRG